MIQQTTEEKDPIGLIAFGAGALLCALAVILFFVFRVPQGIVIGRGHACVKTNAGSFEIDAACNEPVELKRRNDLIMPAPGSKLDEVADGVRLQHGKATFAIWKRSGANALQVRVSHGSIEVVGTRFVVEQTESDGHVQLEEGAIAFHWLDGHATHLAAGESLSWGAKAFAEPTTPPAVLGTTSTLPPPASDAPSSPPAPAAAPATSPVPSPPTPLAAPGAEPAAPPPGATTPPSAPAAAAAPTNPSSAPAAAAAPTNPPSAPAPTAAPISPPSAPAPTATSTAPSASPTNASSQAARGPAAVAASPAPASSSGPASAAVPSSTSTTPASSGQTSAVAPATGSGTTPTTNAAPGAAPTATQAKPAKLSMDEVLAELGNLRNQRKYKEAVTLLRPNAERADLSMSQRARLSYEMGLLLQDRLHEKDNACRHWRSHAERFPENGERAQRVKAAIEACDAAENTPPPAPAPSEESPTPPPAAPQEQHD